MAHEIYCEIVGRKALMRRITVTVDFGDTEDKKPIMFPSILEALDYMGSRGWMLVNAYVMTPPLISTATKYHYVMRKIVDTKNLVMSD